MRASSRRQPIGLSLIALAAALSSACQASPPRHLETETGPATAASEPAIAIAPAAPPDPQTAPSDAGLGAVDAGESEASRAAALLTPPADRSAPERFTVMLETTAGNIQLDVRRSWAPHAADRFYMLIKLGYYDGLPFFRVVPHVLAQIGVHTDPAVDRAWRDRRVAGDSVHQTNNRGMVSFVPDGRLGPATQWIINLDDNPSFDQQGFAPIGRIRELDLAQNLFAGYGELAPRGAGPSMARLQREGSAYVEVQFSKLDRLKRARVTDEKPLPGANTP